MNFAYFTNFTMNFQIELELLITFNIFPLLPYTLIWVKFLYGNKQFPLKGDEGFR